MPEAKPRDTNMPRVLSLLDNDKNTLLEPKAKLRDTNILRVLSLLDNDESTLLVPKAKPRDTNNMLFLLFLDRILWPTASLTEPSASSIPAAMLSLPGSM